MDFQIIPGKLRPLTSPSREPSTSSDHCSNPHQHNERSDVRSPPHHLPRRLTTSLASTALTAAALGLTALGLAGTAGASSNDAAFLAQLAADGITPPSAAAAVSEARAVCKALDQDYSEKDVGGAVVKSTGLSTGGAKTFAVDASGPTARSTSPLPNRA